MLLIVSFCCYFLIEEWLIKDLSIICLSSVKCIRNWWLFLSYKVDFVTSLRSSHRRIRVNFSLLQSTCSFYWRIWSRNSKVIVFMSIFIKVNSSSIIRLFIRSFCFWKCFFSRCNIVGRVFLLKLLFWFIVILIPSILVLSLRRWRRRVSTRRHISLRN